MHRFPRRSAVGRLTPAFLVAICATTALAQEQGVRELERYREVSPSEEIPPLTTHSFSLKPENELDLGFTHLHGFLEQRVVFDDNVFLSKHSERSDTVSLTTPGFLSQTFLGDHRLALAYSPTRRSYTNHPELNAWDHLGSADLRLDFLDAYARVSDAFESTQETRDIRFPGRVSRDTNDIQAEAGLLQGYLGLGALAEHRNRSYGGKVPSFEDFAEDGFKVFARYGQARDHAWLAEYGLLARDFRGDVLNDSVTHTLLGGLEATPRDDVRCLVKAGPVWVDADHGGTVDDDSDLFDLAAEAEVSANLTSSVAARLWYVQRPEFATFSNYQKVYRGGLGVTWDADPGRLQVRGQLFAEKANPSNQASISLIGAGVSVDVDLNRWCKLGAGWECRRRSGAGDLDYFQNQVYVQAVIYF